MEFYENTSVLTVALDHMCGKDVSDLLPLSAWCTKKVAKTLFVVVSIL